MGRLTQLPSRQTLAPSRTTYTPKEERGPKPVQQSTSWKAWYKTKRWRDLRQVILLRDSYTCQRTGRICSGKHPHPDSPVVNHKRPHRGDERLFWDPNNLETVTKAEHDSAIQREEQSTKHHQGVWD